MSYGGVNEISKSKYKSCRNAYQHRRKAGHAKLVLADPQVLANIVKVIVPEFRSYSIDKIIPCIGETVVSLRLPEKLCIRIESVGTEDIDADDGKIVYDIRFPLYYNNRTIKFLVNVEAQRSTFI